MRKNLFLIFTIFLLAGISTYAQMLTGIDPVPESYSSQSISGTEIKNPVDRPAREPITQTDEFGQYNFNAVLTGLGSTGGYLAIPGVPNENVDGSVEAWIYPTATTSAAPCIVGKGDATTVGFLFGISWSSNNLYMRFGGTATINTGGTTIPLNQWTHVACTWSGGAGNYTVTFFVNGAQSGSPATNTGTWNVTSDSTTIGSIRAGFGGKTFYGQIDEVRLWEDVRTLAEIRDNRFVGLGDGSGANTASALTSAASYIGLVASYNFNTGGSPLPDYIGGYNGYPRSGASTVYSAYSPKPMPYNFACIFPFGATDYVTVADNSAFNLSTGGTVEAWVYPTGQSTTHMLMCRGTTGFNFFWGIRASIGNRQVINIGSGTQFANSDGVVIPLNKWTHVAAKWVPGSGNFTVTYYVNGKQSGSPITNATSWNSTSGTLRIGGWHGGTANNFNGRMDEVRLWNIMRSETDIMRTMFVSGRALLPNTSLIGVWNFDGNLLNYSAVSGINGSFSTGGTNNCRISGYVNETTSGALGIGFTAQPTVLNRTGSPNPFPGGYIMKAPQKAIIDLQTIYDTIVVSGSSTLTGIEVFLSIQHTYVSDLSITLKAPNGQTRDLSSSNGTSGDHILTILDDGATSVTTADHYPPWSYIAGPEVTMGSFNSTNIQGNWILSIADGFAGDAGTLMGWGLRFNDAITGTEPITNNIPGKFQLYQNYPNPFNPVTTIKYDIPKSSFVTITLYDILGREVRKLVNDNRTAGTYEIKFDASEFSSGTYFYRIDAGGFSDVRKMVLIK